MPVTRFTKNCIRVGYPCIGFALLLCILSLRAAAQDSTASKPAGNPDTATKIVFLGTGMPRPTPDRQGPSLAIVAGGKAYLVDAGVGCVRQANAAYAAGIKPLKIEDLNIAFITHLHSDHTLGLPDLIFTPWVMGRTAPLELYGPSGTKVMSENILRAYEQDEDIRIRGLEGANANGYKVNAHEIKPGIIYKDEHVSVTAFPVKHGSWREAYGFVFEAGGKRIVISGDTRPAESVINACNGCDALVHEVYSGYGGTSERSPEEWMKYMAAFHTSGEELGALAAKAHTKLLIVTHWVGLGSSDQGDLLAAIKKNYSGTVIIARDLDVVAP
ncbi:MAG TPA: MBL fold metallo-hydrolase [Terriglobales bacterium]|nr:MBL fold metallo-hydrolase [Terriglobales bacterium]